jgi:hypothetical protein
MDPGSPHDAGLRMRARLRSIVCSTVLLGALLEPRVTRACPDCAIGRQVRATLFDERFWPSLAAVALPILIVGVVSALLYRIGKGDLTWRRGSTEEP